LVGSQLHFFYLSKKNQGIRILTSPQVEGLPAANQKWAQSQEMAMQKGLLTSPKRQYQHE
jgi:hypothetical protein